MKSIAIIADIHGNIWALEAVLADIALRGITSILNLGDHLYGSLEPALVADRLMYSSIICLNGNQDRDVFAPSEKERLSADHAFVTGQLSAAHLEWIKNLPATITYESIFGCHGTPTSDETYLLEKVTPQGVFLQDSASIQAQLVGIKQEVIVCGHSHVPRCVWLPDGRLVVNPGSVGIPAYDDDLPYPHIMEAGSPHARYAVLTHTEQGWRAELIAVPYAWEVAAEAARKRGRADRARWIATGRA